MPGPEREERGFDMARDSLHAAIDLGTSKVTTLMARLGRDGLPELIGVGISPSQGVRKGVVVNIQEAQDSVRESVDEAIRSSGVRQPERSRGHHRRPSAHVRSQGLGPLALLQRAHHLRRNRPLHPGDQAVGPLSRAAASPHRAAQLLRRRAQGRPQPHRHARAAAGPGGALRGGRQRPRAEPVQGRGGQQGGRAEPGRILPGCRRERPQQGREGDGRGPWSRSAVAQPPSPSSSRGACATPWSCPWAATSSPRTSPSP